MQREIIQSALQGHDTLALLPTGGGKSICFQVPALCRPGICVVVSPLIALMKDQVENLSRRGIPAIAIYSGMSMREIDRLLDNCVYGQIKFLYLSPERLSTPIFRERLKKMKVNLLAVDEAHCISQWGYDFRPEYLQIAEIRALIPGVNILALTASATLPVVEDMQQKLQFSKGQVFRQSFERSNLHYIVRHVEDKQDKMLEICRKLKGTGIVYVRNRRQSKELAEMLQRNRISADYYHAGLDHKERERRQNSWKQGKCRVMVCTNAFGMGIDKPDVRFVIHYEVPDSLEAYYQEAGRAGRDTLDAYAVLLHSPADEAEARRKLQLALPEDAVIRRVYQALGNYYSLALGAGLLQSFSFDLAVFCKRFKLQASVAYPCIKVLEQEGLVRFSEAVYQPSRIMFTVNNMELYKFQVAHARYDPFIKLLLRMYGGLFDEYVKINENDVAVKAGISRQEVLKQLRYLKELEMLDYVEQGDDANITFLQPRHDAASLRFDKALLEFRRKVATEKTEAILNYATQDTFCRSRFLLAYFHEENTRNCGKCDVCLAAKKTALQANDALAWQEAIRQVLLKKALGIKELVSHFADQEEQALQAIQQLLEHEHMYKDEKGKLNWNRKEK